MLNYKEIHRHFYERLPTVGIVDMWLEADRKSRTAMDIFNGYYDQIDRRYLQTYPPHLYEKIVLNLKSDMDDKLYLHFNLWRQGSSRAIGGLTIDNHPYGVAELYTYHSPVWSYIDKNLYLLNNMQTNRFKEHFLSPGCAVILSEKDFELVNPRLQIIRKETRGAVTRCYLADFYTGEENVNHLIEEMPVAPDWKEIRANPRALLSQVLRQPQSLIPLNPLQKLVRDRQVARQQGASLNPFSH